MLSRSLEVVKESSVYKDSPYNPTQEDLIAKFFCNDRNIYCEGYSAGDGQIQIGIDHAGKFTMRKDLWPYDKEDYAVYETYRTIAAKIMANGET